MDLEKIKMIESYRKQFSRKELNQAKGKKVWFSYCAFYNYFTIKSYFYLF